MRFLKTVSVCMVSGVVSALVLGSLVAIASDPVIMNCVETPEIRDISEMPSVFNLSNNLVRKAGSPVVADGELIHLVGRVTDPNCRPLSNVNVFIWHADARGEYRTDIDENGCEPYCESYDANFLGSGKTTTDNLGNFNFITVIPGKHLNRVPHIHFLLKHKHFPEFQTEMFFKDFSNYEDSNFSRVPKVMRRLLTARHVGEKDGVKVYEFNITLPDNEEDSDLDK